MGMARVIDAHRLISIFAERYPQTAFSISVRDELLKVNSASLQLWEEKLGDTALQKITLS